MVTGYVSADYYEALVERHDTFLKDVREALDAFVTADTASAEGDQNLVTDLEAAFIAEDNPQE